MNITVEEVLKKLWNAIEASESGQASNNGQTYNARAVVAAASEIAKICGFYKHDKTVADNAEAITAQLKELVEKYRRDE